MQIQQHATNLSVTVPGFSLRDTLCCGQCFRWEEQPDGSFFGITGKYPLHIAQDGDKILFFDTDEETFHTVWEPYFDFQTDYEAIRQFLSYHPALRRAEEVAGGIYILRQDPWETLCSFIFSQNNNIPRIKGIIDRFCKAFGEPIAPGVFSFPTPERVAILSLEDLAPIRAGFRAKYILDAAKKVSSGEVNLKQIESENLEEAELHLRKIYGIGPKVAQCILLYGFHKQDAFPVDTWMKKALKAYYPNGFPKRARRYAGVAQQYLFHYIRTTEKQQSE
jgi:N-glycosylase/DNA lyase